MSYHRVCKSIAYIWKQVLKDRNPEALAAAEKADAA